MALVHVNPGHNSLAVGFGELCISLRGRLLALALLILLLQSSTTQRHSFHFRGDMNQFCWTRQSMSIRDALIDVIRDCHELPQSVREAGSSARAVDRGRYEPCPR